MEAYTRNVQTGSGSFQFSANFNSLTGLTVPSNLQTFGLTETLSGFRNPRWRAEVRQNIAAGTDLTAIKLSSRHSTGIFLANGTYYSSTIPKQVLSTVSSHEQVRGLLNAPNRFSAAPAAPANLINLVLGRFWNKAYEELTTESGGVALGQLDKVVHDVKHPLGALQDLLKGHVSNIRLAMKPVSGKRVTRQHVLKVASESWLQCVYGWTPLAADISGTLDSAFALSQSGLFTRRLKAKASTVVATAPMTYTVNVPGSLSNCNYQFGVYTMQSCKYIYKIKGAVIVSFGTSASMLDKLGSFGVAPKDFLPTVWQLVPWSFIVDYFANVGEVIQGFMVPASRVPWASATLKSVHHTWANARVDHIGNSATYSASVQQVSPCWSSYDATAWKRTQYAGSDLPLPGFAFKGALSALHVTDLFALGTNLGLASKSLSRIL